MTYIYDLPPAHAKSLLLLRLLRDGLMRSTMLLDCAPDQLDSGLHNYSIRRKVSTSNKLSRVKQKKSEIVMEIEPKSSLGSTEHHIDSTRKGVYFNREHWLPRVCGSSLYLH